MTQAHSGPSQSGERDDSFFLVDSHCHLDLSHFDEDRVAVLERARAAGVGLIVIPGIDVEQCRGALVLAGATPELYVAVGVHPNSSGNFAASTVDELRQLAAHPKVVAIGEIGLDYYWDKVTPKQQAVAFQAQLALAAALGLPVIIHNRDASDDVAAILEEWTGSIDFRNSQLATRPFPGVLHAFGGDVGLAERAYGWNFLLGIAGPVTFKNARQMHELIPQLRPERLLIETDAPYLTPHPYRGTRNEPGYVALVADKMAELLGESPGMAARRTSATALTFFGLKDGRADAGGR
ncbi:MAG: TatD family deoxyribonuclease [Chloroflexi bacterium]|nr:MAG: TatD family deoxyribonuclease [Chloroflexota bacterium]